ncbi:hypothetical protein [Mucilaginibacter sp.]|uniref:hypothetical protein n=1 Tax=Mucilaginibacter sp. TaxID=1882438 RepID=UPI0032672047
MEEIRHLDTVFMADIPLRPHSPKPVLARSVIERIPMSFIGMYDSLSITCYFRKYRSVERYKAEIDFAWKGTEWVWQDFYVQKTDDGYAVVVDDIDEQPEPFDRKATAEIWVNYIAELSTYSSGWPEKNAQTDEEKQDRIKHLQHDNENWFKHYFGTYLETDKNGE